MLHGGANIWSLSSSGKKLSREDKLHMFKPTCHFQYSVFIYLPFDLHCVTFCILFNIWIKWRGWLIESLWLYTQESDTLRFSFYYIHVDMSVSKIKKIDEKQRKNKGMTSEISSLVRICKISHLYPVWSSV